MVWEQYQSIPAGMFPPMGRNSVMSVMVLSLSPIQPKPPTRIYRTRGSRLRGTGCEVSLQRKVPMTNTKPSFGILGSTDASRLCGQESVNDGLPNLPIAIQFCTGLSWTLESLAALTLSQNSPQ